MFSSVKIYGLDINIELLLLFSYHLWLIFYYYTCSAVVIIYNRIENSVFSYSCVKGYILKLLIPNSSDPGPEGQFCPDKYPDGGQQ